MGANDGVAGDEIGGDESYLVERRSLPWANDEPIMRISKNRSDTKQSNHGVTHKHSSFRLSTVLSF